MSTDKNILPQEEIRNLEKNMDSCRFMRTKQVAKYLDCAVSTVYWLRKTDSSFPKPIKVSGGITLWDTKELDDYVLSKSR